MEEIKQEILSQLEALNRNLGYREREIEDIKKSIIEICTRKDDGFSCLEVASNLIRIQEIEAQIRHREGRTRELYRLLRLFFPD